MTRRQLPSTIRRTDWVMIRFPQDETGKEHKLSRPWHGPYRVLEVTETGLCIGRYRFTWNGFLDAQVTFPLATIGMVVAGKGLVVLPDGW